MCGWFFSSWRKNQSSDNVSHSLVKWLWFSGWQGCWTSCDSLEVCARDFLAPVLSRLGVEEGGALTGRHHDMSNSGWICAGLASRFVPMSSTDLAAEDWLTVFLIGCQLGEGIHSSLSGAFTKFSHTVPCIEALNSNKSMTRTIYRCVANAVVCWVSAIFTLLCIVGSCRLQYKTTGTALNRRLKN